MIKEKIKLRIEKDKRISFSQYMESVLFDKEYGLYETDEVFGANGLFVTSPLISRHFSHCIARNYIEIFESDKINNIAELGPGTGELSLKLISYLKDRGSLPAKCFFYEKSSHLIERQKSLIQEYKLDDDIEFIWINNIKQLPNEVFIIANELFDCIPVDLIKFNQSGFQKAYIDKSFTIVWEDYDFLSQEESNELDLPNSIPENYIFEFSKGQHQIINEINNAVSKAYFIIFDYGYASKELYIPDRHNGTVTCVNNHIADFDPMDDVGKKDISAFVNFTYLKNILNKNNWTVDGFMNQSSYLISYDILSKLDINNVDDVTSVKKLIMPNQMGELFKVLICKKNINQISNNKFIKNDVIKL